MNGCVAELERLLLTGKSQTNKFGSLQQDDHTDNMILDRSSLQAHSCQQSKVEAWLRCQKQLLAQSEGS